MFVFLLLSGASCCILWTYCSIRASIQRSSCAVPGRRSTSGCVRFQPPWAGDEKRFCGKKIFYL